MIKFYYDARAITFTVDTYEKTRANIDALIDQVLEEKEKL